MLLSQKRRSVGIVFSAAASVAMSLAAPARSNTTASWLAPVSGDWTDATKWSSNPKYPDFDTSGITYDVSVAATGSPYAITLGTKVRLATLTLDSPDVTIRNAAPGGGTIDGFTTNRSTISAEGGGTIWLTGGRLDNYGTMTAAAGSTLSYEHTNVPYANPYLNNYGTIQTNGGTLYLAALHNYGSVVATNASVYVSGNTSFDNAGSFTASGSNVLFTSGTIDNTGKTLTFDGAWTLGNWAAITGGTLRTAAGGTVAGAYGASNTFDGVILDTDFNASSTLYLPHGLVISNRTVTLTSPSSSNAADIALKGTIDGTGTIVLNPGSGLHTQANGTIGSGITVRTGGSSSPAHIQTDAGALTNGGTILAQGIGQVLNLYTNPLTNTGTIRADTGGTLTVRQVTNSGTISAATGATLTVGEAGYSWSNTGTITSDSATLNLAGSSTAMGAVSATGGSLNVQGAFTSAQLKSVTLNNVAVAIDQNGVLTNTGIALDVSADMGSLRLRNLGKIVGGTITTSAGNSLIVPSNTTGVVDGVGLNLDAIVQSGGVLTNSNGSTIQSGHVISLQAATLRLNDSTPLTGGGAVVFDGTSGSTTNQVIAPVTTFVLASDMTIRTGTSGGRISNFTNNGLISAQTAGQTIQAWSFSNPGTIEATSAGVFSAITSGSNSSWNNTGTLRASTGGKLDLGGTWSNSATIASDGGSVVLGGTAWNNSGTITASNSSGVTFGGTSASLGSVALSDSAAIITGTYTTPQLTSVSLNNSSIALATGGVIDNTSSTLNISPAFPLQLNGGTLKKGSFKSSGGMTLSTAPGATVALDSVSIDSDLAVGSGGTLQLLGTWQNNVKITADNATLSLGGTFGPSNMGALQHNDGVVLVAGSFANTGNTFSIDSAGTWRLVTGGTISGGTLNATGGATLNVTGGTLAGVNVNAPLDVQSGTLTLSASGITLGSTISIRSAASVVTSTGSRSIGGTGEIDFEGNGSLNSSFGTLTLGTGITVRTTNGDGAVGRSFGGTVINQGTIASQNNGHNIAIDGSFTNQGTCNASNGGTISVLSHSGTTTNSGTFSTSAGGTFTVANPWFMTNITGGTATKVNGVIVALANATLTGGTYAVADNSTLTFSATTINTNAATITLDGASSVFAAVTPIAQNSGVFSITSGRGFSTVGNLTNSGVVNVGSGSTFTATGLLMSTAGSSMGGDGTVIANAGLSVTGNTIKSGGGTLDVRGAAGISIASNAKLDLTRGKMIVRNGAVGSWNGTAYTGITGLIQSGYGPGDFSGTTGIVTSESSATGGNTLTSIGVARADDLGLVGATWGGQSIGAGNTLVMYTYAGDANLDGSITGDDYFQIDSAFPQGANGWLHGDFNYDGAVNGDDYFLIDSNFPAQSNPFAAGAGGRSFASARAVPEPAGISAVAMGATALRRRRRRRGQRVGDPLPK